MEFIYAKELKKKYTVRASFYKLLYNDGKKISCRNVLEIYKKSYYNQLMSKGEPDAIFIMMNPGGSEPKNKSNIPLIKESDIIKNKKVGIKMVLTKPNRTQYQLMRIMDAKGWNHVRVINLSDYRETKSEVFYDQIKQLKSHDKYCIHSIFSTAREKEIEEIIKSDIDHQLIVAWGIDNALDELINQALISTKLDKRVGYELDDNKFYYFHASHRLKRKKLEWLENILSQL